MENKPQDETSTVKRLLKEFKTFAVKGNVIDLAIGVMIGGAFTNIINSAVKDIAMPIIGMFTGVVSLDNWIIYLPHLFGQTAQLKIGNFINTVVSFLILSLVVFLFVKAVNKLKKKQEETPAVPPEPTNEERLLAEIRDLLKEQKDK